MEDMLQSHTARTMLANSELIIMLNQASTDRVELAKLLNISDLQMSYITNVNAGEGLIKIGSSLIPFVNKFPKNTELYKLMTTKPRRRSSSLMRKVIRTIIVILLIGIILISSYFIYKELKQNKEQEDTFDKLIEIIEDNQSDNKEDNNINLSKLYEMNNDLVGWLRIANTNINYPVMQSKNNPDYYLKRDFYKNYSSYGTPYISEQCNIETSDNLVIYGHHMNNKKMFGELENYKKKDYYDQHSIIMFNTLKDTSQYKIFTVFKTVAYSNRGFKYYNYIDFEDEEKFNEFLNKCNELSLYNTNIQPKYGDKLITLSTCEYSKENGRLVVVAYKLDS